MALARRDALAAESVAVAGAAICARLLELRPFMDAGTVCCYAAIGSEAPTRDILQAILARGKQLVLPRTLFAERQLALHRVAGLDGLVPGRYGILEPSPDSPRIDPSEVDIFLVPGVAFDVAGNRLGYGAGFYDNLLAGAPGMRVALAHLCQLLPHLPTDPRDMPMDMIVTEAGVVDCRRGREPSDHLRLRNIQCYGHHGVYPEERERGVRLAFDLDLHLDLQRPGLTDRLDASVDYPAVYRLVERVQSGTQFQLLESLVEHIAAAILTEFPLVRTVTVAARKFHPPVGGPLDAFEVEITRARPAAAATAGSPA